MLTRDDAGVWDVARARLGPVPGVTMSGFGARHVPALRIIPRPALTLVLDFGAGAAVVEDAAGVRRGNVLTGLGFGCGGAARAGGADLAVVQVRLSPVIARAVLGVAPADLDGVAVAADDLLGRAAARLSEQLRTAPSWEARFASTDAWLARLHAAGPRVDPEVAWAWRRMVAGRGAVRVDGLADEVGWSRKRLWSRFRSQIGLAPKRAARLVRFDQAVHRLAAGHGASRVAAESGYADQAHLHRDVVAFTGVTPAAVAGEPWPAVGNIAWTEYGPPRHR